jgi:hypothetical protein
LKSVGPRELETAWFLQPLNLKSDLQVFKIWLFTLNLYRYDVDEYAGECARREANGHDSGMGEIFRRAAAVSPIKPLPVRRLALRW